MRINQMARTLDQIFASEKPEVLAQARAKADEILFTLNLAELRERVQKTQEEMAQALWIKQPTVAGMEESGAGSEIIIA